MLKMFAKLLIEMFTNRSDAQATESAETNLEKL